jgi:predicted alpha/beta-hydrolase family hydrolase
VTHSVHATGFVLASGQRCSALWQAPPDARAAYVVAHGAGAGMTHPFMMLVADGLAQRGIATYRYQFPYMERGSKRPDSAPIAQDTVRAAVIHAGRVLPGIPLVAGGKSFGGRMTSQAQAQAALPNVLGLAFLGFPLHPAGRPSEARGEHLQALALPLLFIQGTRDALADEALIGAVVQRLGHHARLHFIAGADHSFRVPARGRLSQAQADGELLDTLANWIGRVVAERARHTR